ncbi:unnamed protein product, partial [Urochloa humidicola]
LTSGIGFQTRRDGGVGRDRATRSSRPRGGSARWPSGGVGRMVAARHILDGDCDFLPFFARIISMFRLIFSLHAYAIYKVEVMTTCWFSFNQWTIKIFWLCSQLNVIATNPM